MTDGMQHKVDEESKVEPVEYQHAAESNEEEEAVWEAPAIRVHLDG